MISLNASPAAPVSEQPEVHITQWRFVQVVAGDDVQVHLCGVVGETGQGRVTSPVAAVDADSMTVRTTSGRLYHLNGPEGEAGFALVLARAWLASQDLPEDRASVLAETLH